MRQVKIIRSFVRRNGQKISPLKQKYLAEALPKFELSKEGLSERLLELVALKKAISLEVGYGAGEHLVFQASLHPDQIFIGAEVFKTGTAKIIKEISIKKIENIFVYQNDAMDLFANLPDASLDKIFILFPDPWRKKRHHKRRLINDQNLAIFIKKLKSGGLIRIATDHENYASWIIARMINCQELSWLCQKVRDWHKLPNDWVMTKYQEKSLKGKLLNSFSESDKSKQNEKSVSSENSDELSNRNLGSSNQNYVSIKANLSGEKSKNYFFDFIKR